MYSAANAMITSVFFGAAMRNDNVAFATQSKRANCLQRRCVKCLISRKMLGTASTAATGNVSALRSASEKQSIEQQQDHRADDRHDPAGDVILAPEDATNPRANQRACDAE